MNHFTNFCTWCYGVNCNLNNIYNEDISILSTIKMCYPEIEFDNSFSLFACDNCCEIIRNFCKFRSMSAIQLQNYSKYCKSMNSTGGKTVLIKMNENDKENETNNSLKKEENFTEIEIEFLDFKPTLTFPELTIVAIKEETEDVTNPKPPEVLATKHMDEHSFTPSGDKLIQCNTCSKMLKRRGLWGHMKTHSQRNPFKCFKCNAVFLSAYSISKHIGRKCRNATITCLSCNTVLNKSKLFAHDCQSSSRETASVVTHDEQFQFTCQHCKKLLTGVNLNQHECTLFTCNVCNLNFSAQMLIVHMFLHTQNYGKLCSICRTRLASPRDMKKHLLNHTEIARIFCSKCGSTFSKVCSLNKHSCKSV